MKKEERIEVIDGFRCLAVFAVMFYHFYSRHAYPISAIDYYPYHHDYAQYFKAGFLGVNFFFMISGFVIFYTLEKSKSVIGFFYKRFIRLFPAMLLCSIITYLFMEYVDQNREFPGHVATKLSFIPSWTFTKPVIWNALFNRHDITNISGCYWSLWVEVSFYLLAGLTYFFNKKGFLSSWVRIALVITFLRIIIFPGFQPFLNNNLITGRLIFILREGIWFFNVSLYITYFTLGILFYTLFSEKHISRFNLLAVIFISVLEIILFADMYIGIALILMIGLFIVFIYKRSYLDFLTAKFFTRIGVISYTLYLIHECIGLVLIQKLSALTQSYLIISLLPLGVIMFFILFSEIVFRLYEKPLNRFLKKVPARFLSMKSKPQISDIKTSD